jgi:hypothetical protein
MAVFVSFIIQKLGCIFTNQAMTSQGEELGALLPFLGPLLHLNEGSTPVVIS